MLLFLLLRTRMCVALPGPRSRLAHPEGRMPAGRGFWGVFSLPTFLHKQKKVGRPPQADETALKTKYIGANSAHSPRLQETLEATFANQIRTPEIERPRRPGEDLRGLGCGTRSGEEPDTGGSSREGNEPGAVACTCVLRRYAGGKVRSPDQFDSESVHW